MEISAVNTKSVRIPSAIDATLVFDFSNVKMTAAATREDAIDTVVMNGVNDLR